MRCYYAVIFGFYISNLITLDSKFRGNLSVFVKNYVYFAVDDYKGDISQLVEVCLFTTYSLSVYVHFLLS